MSVWLAKRRLGYAFTEPVDHDPAGTGAAYPAGVWAGVARLWRNRREDR